MRCKKCGFNLLPGMTVCPACDTAVEGNQGSPSAPKAGGKANIQSGDNVISKEVINRVRNSCLRIHSAFGAGSGFVTHDRLIVTNAHVVTEVEGNQVYITDDLKAMFFTNENKKYALKLIGYDIVQDVAVLKFLDYNKPIDELVLADSDKVELGDRVFTIGNPLDYGFTYTEGSVACPYRKSPVPGKDDQLQLSMVINHGNSGGPVFNTKGEVIGIVTFSMPVDERKEIMIGEDIIPIVTTDSMKDMPFCVTAHTISQVIARFTK